MLFLNSLGAFLRKTVIIVTNSGCFFEITYGILILKIGLETLFKELVVKYIKQVLTLNVQKPPVFLISVPKADMCSALKKIDKLEKGVDVYN